MKIAYTINGIIGGLAGKNSDQNNPDLVSKLAEFSYKSIDKNILKNNDVDIFLFSWHLDEKDSLKKIYKPKKSLFMKQINFDVPSHLKEGADSVRVQAHYSRWYGFNEVMKLRREYEQENNIKYDLVINARFDMYWNKPIDFSQLNVNDVHLATELENSATTPTHPAGFAPNNWAHMIDHVIVMNPSDTDRFATMFDKLDEYTLPGQCPQWAKISSHFMFPWHLKKLGLLDKIKFPFSIVGAWPEGGDNINQTYTILRYKTDEILKGIKK
jgi:hypothetical protein|tara:strand:- start:182 stop:991 length:810 start_codon:yes stop_codon:yes gene_type:complete